MKKKTKKIIAYSLLFAASVAYFIIAVFVLQAPDGIAGFLLCLASISACIVSFIRLYQLTAGKGLTEAIIDAVIIFLFG